MTFLGLLHTRVAHTHTHTHTHNVSLKYKVYLHCLCLCSLYRILTSIHSAPHLLPLISQKMVRLIDTSGDSTDAAQLLQFRLQPDGGRRDLMTGVTLRWHLVCDVHYRIHWGTQR